MGWIYSGQEIMETGQVKILLRPCNEPFLFEISALSHVFCYTRM
jgi:hypothetical protein